MSVASTMIPRRDTFHSAWAPVRYRRAFRNANRPSSGASRRREPDYLALACRAVKEAIRLGNSLRPFLHEKAREFQHSLQRQEIEAALRRVYGPGEDLNTPPQPVYPTAKELRDLEKRERAVAKSRLLLVSLRKKMNIGKETVKNSKPESRGPVVL